MFSRSWLKKLSGLKQLRKTPYIKPLAPTHWCVHTQTQPYRYSLYSWCLSIWILGFQFLFCFETVCPYSPSWLQIRYPRTTLNFSAHCLGLDDTVLRIKPRALCVLGKHSNNWATSPALHIYRLQIQPRTTLNNFSSMCRGNSNTKYHCCSAYSFVSLDTKDIIHILLICQTGIMRKVDYNEQGRQNRKIRNLTRL